jgi:putative transcriptional regulator
MKEKRNKLGLTQEQVAECACVSVRSYKMYEAHQRKPNVYAALRIARVLQTTVEELFAGGELYGT